MRFFPLLTALCAMLAPAAPALAETYACRLTETCENGLGCNLTDTSAEPLILTLDLSESGETGTFGDDTLSLDLNLVTGSEAERSWLFESPGQGIGLLTLTPEGSLVMSAHEFRDYGLHGTSHLAECQPGTP